MNRHDIALLSSLAEIIRKEGAITKGNLWKNSNLGIFKYEKIYSYIPVIYKDIIYDRKKKKFTCASASLSLFIQEAEK